MTRIITIGEKELKIILTSSPNELSRMFGETAAAMFTRDLLYTPRIAEILVKVDMLLPIGGTMAIDCVDLSDRGVAFRRSAPQIQYSLGSIFRGHYELVERRGSIQEFKKRADRRMYGGKFEGISIGIISDGKKRDPLIKLCEVATKEAPLPVEIMVCGPKESLIPLKLQFPSIVILDDIVHGDLRAPINKKKLRLISEARYDNLVLAHDRFFFDREWYERLVAYGNYFDFYHCRWCDLSAFPMEVSAAGGFAERIHPITGFTYHTGSSWATSPNSNPSWYLNGGLYIGKTRIFREIGFPEFLNWGDMEDVHFSRQLQLEGWVVQTDCRNRVFTTTTRLGRAVRPRYVPILRAIRRLLFKAVFAIRYGGNTIID